MIGQAISHYRIDAKIGGGGMGVVYRAQDTRLGRAVALKFLPPDLAGDEVALERFQREARAVSALNHPNICTLYDLGDHEGQPYLVMELLQGRTLHDVLAGDPMDPATVVELGRQMADALDAAHSAGIIHRDLKPANLFVSDRGQVKILDFGLAKRSQESDADAPTQLAGAELTDAGRAVGTISYMSPEQARGEDLDARTDLFSLGVVLYEMITAKPAFAGNTSAVIFDAILHKTPAAPVRLNPETPEVLEETLSRLLEKDRELRYQSAADLRAALTRISRTATTTGAHIPRAAGGRTSGSGSDSAIATQLARRHRGPVVAVGIALLFLVAAAAFGLVRFFGGRAVDTSIRSLAVLPFAVDGGDEDLRLLGDGVGEGLINHLAGMADMRVASRNSSFRYRGDVDLAEVSRDLDVQAIVTGRLRTRNGQTVILAELVDPRRDAQLWGSEYVAAGGVFRVQEQIARAVAERLGIVLAANDRDQLTQTPTANQEAYRLYLRGRSHWSRRTNQDVQQALVYFEQALDLDPNYALAWAGKADCYQVGNGDYLGIASDVARRESRAAAQRALELDQNLVEAMVTLADVSTYTYEFERAEALFVRALELNPNYATGHQWYTELLHFEGRFDEGVVHMEQALRLDPLSSIQHESAALAYFFADRFDDALRQADLAMAGNLENDFPELIKSWVLWERGLEQEWVDAMAAMGERRGVPGLRSQVNDIYRSQGLAGVLRLMRDIMVAMPEEDAPPDLLFILAELGELDQAFALMERLLAVKSAVPLRIRYHPYSARLSEDPRYNELFVKYGLPPETRI